MIWISGVFFWNFEVFAVLKSVPACCAMVCMSLCFLLLSTLLSCVSYSCSSWDWLTLMLLALGPSSCQMSSFMYCSYSWGLPSAFIDEFLDSHTEELVNDPFFVEAFTLGFDILQNLNMWTHPVTPPISNLPEYLVQWLPLLMKRRQKYYLRISRGIKTGSLVL